MKPKQILLILTAIIVLVIACAAIIIEDVGDAHILYRPVQVTATAMPVVVEYSYPPPVEWYPPPVYEPTAYPAPATSTPRPIPTMPMER